MTRSGALVGLAAVLLVLLVLVLILAALVLAPGGPPAAALPIVLGGARRARGGFNQSSAAPGEAARHHSHPVGEALGHYARGLGPSHAVGVHPLDRDRYEAPEHPRARGGAARPARAPKGDAETRWTEFKTWDALAKDGAASAAYLAQRAAVLNNPNLDWGPVLREVGPKLAENREYIGLANLEPDGRTLRLEALEASPVEVGTSPSKTTFAAVPGDLVAKYARRPALFLFHTHPADPRASPLPSSHDLSTCIYFAAVARFAANVVISRFGVFAYGLDWAGYKSVNEAKDWTLAMLNLSHDVVVAHEAIRSWASYTLQDYLGFYPRHRLFVFVYPTPEMVGEGRLRFQWDLESPIDHEVISEHSRDVREHLDGKPAVVAPGMEQKRKSILRTDATARLSRDVADLMGVDLGLD